MKQKYDRRRLSNGEKKNSIDLTTCHWMLDLDSFTQPGKSLSRFTLRFFKCQDFPDGYSISLNREDSNYGISHRADEDGDPSYLIIEVQGSRGTVDYLLDLSFFMGIYCPSVPCEEFFRVSPDMADSRAFLGKMFSYLDDFGTTIEPTLFYFLKHRYDQQTELMPDRGQHAFAFYPYELDGSQTGEGLFEPEIGVLGRMNEWFIGTQKNGYPYMTAPLSDSQDHVLYPLEEAMVRGLYETGGAGLSYPVIDVPVESGMARLTPTVNNFMGILRVGMPTGYIKVDEDTNENHDMMTAIWAIKQYAQVTGVKLTDVWVAGSVSELRKDGKGYLYSADVQFLN